MMTINWNEFSDPMVKYGVQLMREINDRGYEAYIVGGAVRDLVMGDKSMNDIDIATNMPIDVIKASYHAINYGGGEKHGTVIVHINGHDYELTQFRTEDTYTDGRRPDSVEFVSSFEEDTKRRDFTINAMGVGWDGQVIDFHCGMVDIDAKVLNTVGEPKDRFTEDALRMLRAIRFSARFGFDMSSQVYYAIKDLRFNIRNVSMERVRDELLKISSYGSTKLEIAISLMDQVGLLDVILPEIIYSSRVRYNLSGAHDITCPIVNLSLLFYGLDKETVSSLCKRLKLDNSTLKGILFCIENVSNYGRLYSLDRQVSLKLVNNVYFDELREVYKASRNSHDCIPFDLIGVDYEIATIREFNKITAFEKNMSGVLMAYMNPGKEFGQVLQIIRDWVFAKFESDSKVVSLDELERHVERNIDSWRNKCSATN